jgi:hypothetical protein
MAEKLDRGLRMKVITRERKAVLERAFLTKESCPGKRHTVEVGSLAVELSNRRISREIKAVVRRGIRAFLFNFEENPIARRLAKPAGRHKTAGDNGAVWEGC